MSAALDARGLKRICMSCGTRFYDLKKRPIVCPSCKAEFTGEIKVKTRRGRLAAVPEADLHDKSANDKNKIVHEDDDVISPADLDEVSLEDVKDLEEDADDVDGLDDETLEEDLGEIEDIDVLEEDDEEDDLELDVDIDKE